MLRVDSPLARLIVEEWKSVDKIEMRDRIEELNAHRENMDSDIRLKRRGQVLDTDMILDLNMWQNQLDKRGLVNGIRLA